MNLKSFAKINLFLEIVGKYENGFHAINSIVSCINLYDEILILKNKNLEISIKGEFGSLIDENNMDILFEHLKHHNFLKNTNFLIEINKNIPVGAGLGGGSGNVATVLNFLEEKKFIKKENKLLIAREMGSDIEFFLDKKPALLSGKGVVEKRVSIESTEFLLLVYPNKVLNTGEVYSLNKKIDNKTSFRIKSDQSLKLKEIMNITNNTLEEIAIELCPEIKTIKNDLLSSKSCIYAKMSGSGSCCYGVYNAENDAKNAEKDLLNQHPDWWTCVTKLI